MKIDILVNHLPNREKMNALVVSANNLLGMDRITLSSFSLN